VFVALFVVGLVDLALSIWWLARPRRRAASAIVTDPYLPVPSYLPVPPPAPIRPAAPYEPSGEGVRLERLKTLAGLRDSGALTEEEFQTEKRRILEGH
jgi:Short C-terminal domain